MDIGETARCFLLMVLQKPLIRPQGGERTSCSNTYQYQSHWNKRGRNRGSYINGEGLQRNKQSGNDGRFGIDKSIGGIVKRCIANTITAREDRGVSKHKQTGTAVAIPIEVVGHTRQVEGYGEDRERVIGAHGISPTLRSTDFKEPYKIAIPVSTPEITLKSQNGRRFKENGDEAFTLTARDRHGVALGLDIESSKDHLGMYVELEDGSVVYAVWYEKYACYIAIRKLTPRECFKLQGWDDEYFDRAEFVNSDSQLYKQAGNGVTVNVVYEIAKRIAEIKEV
jgi:DNA (cytosine-5)-methyltransferase 1